MKPQTEVFLYYLLWTAEQLMRPTWANLNESFEGWAWRNRLDRRLAQLERQKLIESHPQPDLHRIVRLTEEGRRMALGGRDPVEQWSRPWDGLWRLLLFDLPVEKARLRMQLWRSLRAHHFGYLQGSVWVSPDPTGKLREILGTGPAHPESSLLIEGRPAAGESDEEIVSGAWDFALVNRRYQQYLEFLRQPPPTGPRLMAWSQRENRLWLTACRTDPLLPQQLLPPGYLGKEAFTQRAAAFSILARTTPARNR